MIEALAHAGIPTIPVRVWHDGDKWRKRPLADKWDEATTDCEVLARWSRQWPEALPGVPLERVGWVAIDVDADDAAFWEVWEGLGPRGPYSKIQTVSGGWHFVFAQPPEQITRFKWTEGVEILGTASVLTVYDVEEILFPRVAPRAILPEVFRKPYARSHVCPIKKREAATAPQRDGADVDVADATAALWKMDPCDWCGDYDGWFHLAGACKAVGISRREFVRWSGGDPLYAADGRTVARIWDSAIGAHGGALWAALATWHIRVSAKPNAKRTLYPEVPHGATERSGATEGPPALPDLRDQSRRLIAWLNAAPSEDRLFRVGCVFAERGMLREVALSVLKSNCAALRRALGDAEFSRTIENAFRHVEEKQIVET